MSEIRYEAHPLVFRMRPLSTLFSIALMCTGIVFVGMGRYVPAPRIGELSAGVGGLGANTLSYLGIAIFVLAAAWLYVRYFPTRFERLTVTDDTLTWTRGFLTKQVMKVPFSAIRELKVESTAWQRRLYIGDLSVYAQGQGDQPALVVKGLPIPEDILPVFERRAKP